MIGQKRKTVFVGLSGGVDSSVAAYLLKKEGYDVVGVFIKVWQPPFLRCHWEDERLDAMRVAATLGIPFLTCDAEEAYRHDVAEYFIREYEVGNTPNPDVMCNTHVKFGRFFAFAREHGADFIATGHYAQTQQGKDGTVTLCTSVDASKDQSYFLWNIKRETLPQVLFPLGGLQKSEVREIAKRAGLPTAAKRDSQGICFLGDVDIKEFLAHYITLTPGPVLNTQGREVGTHDGALLYTSGQRHGFSLSDVAGVPHYVVARDIKANTITVSEKKPHLNAKEGTVTIDALNRLQLVTVGARYEGVMRYHGPRIPLTLKEDRGDSLILVLEAEAEMPSQGQSLVLYEDNRVVLGGIIRS